MDTRRRKYRAAINRTFIPMALLIFSQFGRSQIRPMMLGELEVVVKNPQASLSVTADASGSPVGASWHLWYPITHNFDQRSATTYDFKLTHCDRVTPPDTSSTSFAYGNYLITIYTNQLPHTVYMDYRDADYNDGTGQYGTDYTSNADLTIYYNQGDGNYYTDANFTHQIPGYIAVWEGGRKSSGPRIPVTVKNSFDGADGGQITADGASQNSPYKQKWNADENYPPSQTIEAITPQTINALIYQFSSWSDAGSQSHSVQAALHNFGKIWTANFSVQKPTRVAGVTAGGTIGYPVHVSWSTHPNSDVNYCIYRKVKHNGIMGNPALIATLSHSTTSFDDPDYTLVGHSSDLLYYDVRAHHVPSGTYADQSWTCGGYGELKTTPPPPESTHIDRLASYELTAHPNPFNPSTTIEYQLAGPGNISLVVYDVNGRQVSEIARGRYDTGRYTTRWDGAACATGVYYLRFTVTNSIGGTVCYKTEKLLLMK